MGRCSQQALLGLLSAAAVLVGWRRLAGALSSPLEPPVLLAAGAMVAAAALGARLPWRLGPKAARRSRPSWAQSLVLSASVLVLGASLSLPGTAASGLVALWAVLAAEELWAWRPLLWPRLRRGSSPATRSERRLRWGDSCTVAPEVAVQLPPQQSAGVAVQLPPQQTDVPPEEVLQQLTRSQAADGSEQLSGWLRIAFAAGQRTGSVHVAFCPPFARTPELVVEQLAGPEARIKTAQLLPYGVRLDLKLNAAGEQAASVLLQFSAQAGARGKGLGIRDWRATETTGASSAHQEGREEKLPSQRDRPGERLLPKRRTDG